MRNGSRAALGGAGTGQKETTKDDKKWEAGEGSKERVAERPGSQVSFRYLKKTLPYFQSPLLV